MSVKKVVSFIISIAVWTSLIFVLFKLSKSSILTESRVLLKDKVAILLSNVSNFISPSRRPPVTTIELEQNLKNSLSLPFDDFSENDWKWFWRLLYERFPVDSQGWPKRKRQLTRQEIEGVLTDYYYQPFGSFKQQQWDIFWEYILKGQVFERQQ